VYPFRWVDAKVRARQEDKGVLNSPLEEPDMLRYALIFFIVAIVAAIFGFSGIAGSLAGIAKILFYIFVAVFVISLVMGLIQGRKP